MSITLEILALVVPNIVLYIYLSKKYKTKNFFKIFGKLWHKEFM